MDLYYVENLEGESTALTGDQLRHAVKVRRMKVGDELLMTDGAGWRITGRISTIGRNSAEIRVTDRQRIPRSAYHIDIAMAYTKNIKRVEWALEKMTEMGVRSVQPLVCHRSERSKANDDRLHKILIAAIKQSQQYYLPELHPIQDLKRFIQKSAADAEFQRCIAHLSDESMPLVHNYRRGSDVLIMIGPEGDFTREELDLALDAGYSQVSIGPTRLRTETAAVAAVAYIHALND